MSQNVLPRPGLPQLSSSKKGPITGRMFSKPTLIPISATLKLTLLVADTVKGSLEQKSFRFTLLIDFNRIPPAFTPVGSLPFELR